MADVTLNHVYKVYPNGVKAVSDMTINIKDKEFIVLVGPSGCGKSTTLRMIAGLEEITTGDLFIGPNLVNDVQPKDRDIAMVFQNYALYPHMTVYENIAFSLKNRHMPKAEINRRVLEAARILGIEEYLQRKPKAMSGGQRQRVALGRAIVRNPKVFLLDEPLSNLDAKLRAQMRTEITKLYKKLGTTFIYVTHDQIEAMTMGTRIVVMRKGFAQQIDTPTNLYNHPINKFVAGFIGTPQMNFFNVTLAEEGENVKIEFEDKQNLVFPAGDFIKCDPEYLDGKTVVTLGVRPDDILISEKEENAIKAVITSIEHLGNETLLYCDLGRKVRTEQTLTSQIIVRLAPTAKYKSGDVISLVFRGEKLHLFDLKDERSVMPFFPTYTKVKAVFSGKDLTIFGQKVSCPPAFASIPAGEHLISIPNDSVIDGKSFELTAVNCEAAGESRYLVTLFSPETKEYLFSTSPVPVGKGQKVGLDIAYEDLRFSDNGIKPVVHEVESVGHFIMRREKDLQTNRRKVCFYAEAGGAYYPLKDDFVKRFFAIEGRRALKDSYRLRFTPLVEEKDSNAISHQVGAVLDYGRTKYLRAMVGDEECYIDITADFAKGRKDYSFTFDVSKPLDVYTLQTDVKLI